MCLRSPSNHDNSYLFGIRMKLIDIGNYSDHHHEYM